MVKSYFDTKKVIYIALREQGDAVYAQLHAEEVYRNAAQSVWGAANRGELKFPGPVMRGRLRRILRTDSGTDGYRCGGGTDYGKQDMEAE